MMFGDGKLCTSSQTHHLQVKHDGGSIELWRCFSAGDPPEYHQILEDHPTHSAGGLPPEKKIDFPARRQPHACSRSPTEMFRNNNPMVLERPSQSPDLSPIQNMCLDLKSCSHLIPEQPDRASAALREEWRRFFFFLNSFIDYHFMCKSNKRSKERKQFI